MENFTPCRLPVAQRAVSLKRFAAFLHPFLAFSFPACIREQREKILKITVNFLFSGVVGSERKNISHKRAEHRPTGVIVGKGKRAEKPLSFVSLAEREKRKPKAGMRFCPSRETCWGVPSPNPAMRLAPQKYFRPAKSFFSLLPRKWLTDRCVFCDK